MSSITAAGLSGVTAVTAKPSGGAVTASKCDIHTGSDVHSPPDESPSSSEPESVRLSIVRPYSPRPLRSTVAPQPRHVRENNEGTAGPCAGPSSAGLRLRPNRAPRVAAAMAAARSGSRVDRQPLALRHSSSPALVRCAHGPLGPRLRHWAQPVGAVAQSSSVMVPVAAPRPMAAPRGLVSVTVKCSSGSGRLSSTSHTDTVRSVWPGANTTVCWAVQ